MIKLVEVSKVYHRGPEAIQALDCLNVQIESGEFVAITGKSGCGKSTLLHIIGALEPVSRGRVFLDGRDLAQLAEPELTRFRRDRVGVVFQSFNLLPLLTLEENVALPRVLQGAAYGQAQQEAANWLGEVGLSGRRDHKPHQVSGGEMQRAAIARALINQPAVILADEPTGNLDSVTAAEILALFSHLHRQWGKTIILVSHAPEAGSAADRVLRLQDGRLLRMRPWLFRISLSHLAQYPGRTLLGILGIALGTAVYLSISLAAASALESFQAGVRAVAGQAQWRIQTPGAPLDESLFVKVRRLPSVAAAAPAVESVLELTGEHQGPVLLLGIDPFSERPFRDYAFSQAAGLSDTAWTDFFTRPGAVLVSRPLASRLEVKAGDALPVMVGPRRQTLRVAGIFTSASGLYPLDGAVLLMDIGPAQELLDRVGGLDYIDVIGAGPPAEVQGRLQAALPPGVEVVRPAAQGSRTEGLVASYRLNLAVLSAIALFVGMFLIYQSVTLSVVRRRREIGLLRTLGMTPGQVLLLFLAEGLASGLVGGLLGLVLGVGLARGVLAVMTQNLSSLYMPVVAQAGWGPGRPPAPGLGPGRRRHPPGGLVYPPGRRPAPNSGPCGTGRNWKKKSRAERGSASVGVWRPWSWPGWELPWKINDGPPWPGFAAAFLILLGFALFTPLAARLLGQGLQPIFRKILGPAGDLGCRYLAGSLSRSAVSIAALACALGMLIAVTVMIGSFRQTVNDWVSRAISGDIFFGPAVFSTAAYDQYLPPEVLPELQRDPEVADIYLYRCVRIPFQDRYILVIGGSFEVLARHGGLWFRQGEYEKDYE